MKWVLNLFNRFKNLIIYGTCSVVSTIFDTAVVWIMFHLINLDLAVANTGGIIVGFLFDFFVSSRIVFKTKYSPASFLIYFSTFIVGLFVANFLITYSYDIAILHFSEGISFLISKAVSIVLPFFGLYFIRKGLYSLLNRRSKPNE